MKLQTGLLPNIRIVAQYIEAYEAGWCLFGDVLPCLDGLTGCPIGIVSNGQAEQQRKKLSRTGIIARFDHIVISEEVGFAKPNPAIFHRACALFGKPPSDSVYIGDRYEADAVGARMAGLRGIWLDRKGQATAEHEPPLIESLSPLSFGTQGGLLRGATGR